MGVTPMKKNMGAADRVVRILVAIGVAALYLTGTISGVVAIVLGVVAAVFLATGAAGFCPGYVPLGISTRRERSESVRV
jgi:hypothetical protein